MSRGRRIHVVDDDEELRWALASVLTRQGFEARQHVSALSFLENVAPDEGDCVLLDLRMPEMSGLELLVKMKEARFFMPVVMMTAYANVELAIRVMKEGAVDLLQKPFSDETLMAALRVALAQREHEREREAKLGGVRARLATLTPREVEVLSGLLQGRSNKIIAHRLGIGVRTVETHRAMIMEKMGVESLPELVRASLLVELDHERQVDSGRSAE
jgi:two-component system response regulator FixJ